MSSHKTDAVQSFLGDRTNVSIHYIPTYSSWLNQVENRFARIQHDVITRGVFTSTKDLDKKLMRYILQYNQQAAPLKWKYADPSRRIRGASFGSVDQWLAQAKKGRLLVYAKPESTRLHLPWSEPSARSALKPNKKSSG